MVRPAPATLAPFRVGDDLRMIIVAGPDAGRCVRVGREGATLGRDPTANIILSDPGISAQHAELKVVDDGGFELCDLGSRYGIFNSGQAVARQLIKDGDRFQISGETEVRFRYGDLDPMNEARDPVTRLPIRSYFNHRLEQDLAFARRHQQPLAMMLVDIDYFEVVAAVGEDEGRAQELLRQVGRALSNTLRSEDVLARYGDDEFAILVRALPEAQLAAFAERLIRLIDDRTFDVDTESLHLTVSIGIGARTAETIATDEIIGASEAALCEAKRKGRNRCVSFRGQPQT